MVTLPGRSSKMSEKMSGSANDNGRKKGLKKRIQHYRAAYIAIHNDKNKPKYHYGKAVIRKV